MAGAKAAAPRCEINSPTECRKPRELVSARDDAGHRYYACAAHFKYLAGWVQDANAERYADSRAAADFEDRAYGRD